MDSFDCDATMRFNKTLEQIKKLETDDTLAGILDQAAYKVRKRLIKVSKK